MADDEEKTQAPSAHKIQKAREEGNVSKSPEFVGFFVLLVGLGLMFFLIPFWVQGSEKIFLYVNDLMNIEVDSKMLGNLMLSIVFEVFVMLAPLFIALVLTGILANIAQFGLLLSPKAIKPKLSKINPISGVKNVISLKKILDGFMITLKVFIAFIVGFAVFVSFFDELSSVSMSGLYVQILWFREKALILIGVLLIVFFIMAVSDYLIKKYQYTKSLKMSIKEVKDEYKQYEQSPEIKAKIRRMQQKLVLVAKGIDELAIRIKAIAREYGIRIVENPPLARALYQQLDLNQSVPPEFFGAVVQVLQEIAELDALEGKMTLSDTIRKAQESAGKR